MDFVGIYGQILEWSVVVIALVILVSGLDDLFIDAYYWIRQAYRGLVIRPRHPPLDRGRKRNLQPCRQHSRGLSQQETAGG